MDEVAIAGGGPAGLAAAIRCAQRGFRTVVFERAAGIPDKACGEGLMPSGVRELQRLGVRMGAEQSAPFRGIRYVMEDGTTLEARFGAEDGVGVRRTVLARALRERALESGAELRQATVTAIRPRAQSVELILDGATHEARLAIAADGLHSPLRRAAGLDGGRPRAPARYGVRRHFSLAPWSDFVEVYWVAGVEAYVTPVGPRSVNVALLRDRNEGEGFEALLVRFPALRERIGGAAFDSELRGAGPLLQHARARWAPRLALIGDAAGYVDAITGQGLSLAFVASAILTEALPRDLAQNLAPALKRYDAAMRIPWLKYAIPAQALVALSRRPALRRVALRSIAHVPGAFAALVRAVG